MSQTADPVADIARAAARRLAADHGVTLPIEVEAALHSRGRTRPPDRYLDPVSVGALVVSVASLAWTIYTDLKTRTLNPPADVVARMIRIRLSETRALDPATRDRIIDVVVGETPAAGRQSL